MAGAPIQPAVDQTAEVERALAEATSQALAVVTVTASTPAQSPQPSCTTPQPTAPTVVTQIDGAQPSTQLARSDSLVSCVSVASLAVMPSSNNMQQAAPEGSQYPARPMRAILRNRLHPGGLGGQTDLETAETQPSAGTNRARSVAYNSSAKRAQSDGK